VVLSEARDKFTLNKLKVADYSNKQGKDSNYDFKNEIIASHVSFIICCRGITNRSPIALNVSKQRNCSGYSIGNVFPE
jgi:hypothetical protein